MTVHEYGDDFDTGSVDPRKWYEEQIKPHQVRFETGSVASQQSIVTSVTSTDVTVDDGKLIQRAELRTEEDLRPDAWDEFWHGFSFRVSGDIPRIGSLRTVLGQWKAPGDRSPFLAQRFDNGVFHVTVQDGGTRKVVATAFGDPDRLNRFQKLLAQYADSAPGLIEVSRALAELKAFKSGHGPLPDSDDHVQWLQTVVNQLNFNESDNVQALFDEFYFVQELDAYAGVCDIRTKVCEQPILPDPKDDWVHMAYRIKPGRLDNDPQLAPCREGEVDIYANGQRVAQVRGNLGYRLTEPAKQRSVYFKFGVYRDYTVGKLNLHFDNFWQSDKLRKPVS